MASINQLSAASALSLGDLLAVYSSGNGDARKASLSLLLAFLQGQMTAAGGLVSQYSAPTTGFTVTIAPPTAGASMWLLLTPAGTLATGTLALPSQPVHGQEVLVTSTQTITALSFSGGTVYGAPSTLAANGYFRLRYDGVLAAWFRIN